MGNQIDALAARTEADRRALAARVKEATARLNDALFDAAEAGLVVDVSYLVIETIVGPPSYRVRSEVMERL
jgi:hypothetical protein